MKWETLSSGIGYRTYALWNNGRKVLTVAFNSSSDFVKIESKDEKRAFTIRHEGFLKNKMVMRNEYGIRMGSVNSDNRENQLTFNDEKLSYAISGDEDLQVIIYKESIERPSAICSLHLENDKSILSSVRPTATHQSLLLILCWYLYLPVAKENIPAFV